MGDRPLSGPASAAEVRAGMRRPDPAADGGSRGLWVVRQLCDRVEISTGPAGSFGAGEVRAVLLPGRANGLVPAEIAFSDGTALVRLPGDLDVTVAARWPPRCRSSWPTLRTRNRTG